MVSIQLKDVKLLAHHGLYPDESKTGNIYHIDLSVNYDEGNMKFDSIEDTIDYVALYEIIKLRMQSTTALLEKLCDEIIQQIKMQYPFVTEVVISVKKIQAPIENFEGKVGVTFRKVFNG